jgi:hypothetical protein
LHKAGGEAAEVLAPESWFGQTQLTLALAL